MQDFKEGTFKNDFTDLVNARIKKMKNSMLSNCKSFKDLKFEQGLFRHIGRDVFFHFFKPASLNSKIELSLKELREYYRGKITNQDQ